jgi:pyoverdine/dityrosine biosynthesis protein Dit1
LPTSGLLTSEQLARWTSPHEESSLAPVHRDKRPDELAGVILELLLKSRFRKGSLEAMGSRSFLERHAELVSKRVEQDLPIQLTLIGFPFKAPNPLKVGQRTLPDLAELAALKRFHTLNAAVRSIYVPGIEIVIIQDGTYIARALEVPISDVRSYTDYFRGLLRLTRADDFIRCEDLSALMEVHAPLAEGPSYITNGFRGAEAERTDQVDAVFLKTLGMLNLRRFSDDALSSLVQEVAGDGPMPRSRDAQMLDRRVRKAMERYHALDTLLHRFDPRPLAFPEAIHATTRSQPGRLALWLVRRGRGLLPWQGVGVVRANGCLDVAYLADLERSGTYLPVFVEGESTPFLYEQLGERPQGFRREVPGGTFAFANLSRPARP